jgi:hypothetical protein
MTTTALCSDHFDHLERAWDEPNGGYADRLAATFGFDEADWTIRACHIRRSAG